MSKQSVLLGLCWFLGLPDKSVCSSGGCEVTFRQVGSCCVKAIPITAEGGRRPVASGAASAAPRAALVVAAGTELSVGAGEGALEEAGQDVHRDRAERKEPQGLQSRGLDPVEAHGLPSLGPSPPTSAPPSPPPSTTALPRTSSSSLPPGEAGRARGPATAAAAPDVGAGGPSPGEVVWENGGPARGLHSFLSSVPTLWLSSVGKGRAENTAERLASARECAAIHSESTACRRKRSNSADMRGVQPTALPSSLVVVEVQGLHCSPVLKQPLLGLLPGQRVRAAPAEERAHGGGPAEAQVEVTPVGDVLESIRGLPCLHLGEHVPKQSVLGMLPGRGAAQAIEEVRVPRARILVLRPLRRQRRGEHVPDGDHLDAVGRLAVDRGGHAQVPAEVLELRPPQHRRRHADRRGRAGAPTPARRAGRRGASANFRGRCLGFGNLIRILAGAPYSRA
eukprot:CAMPEP_0204149962 /NCGR_PEP_ID=MMETSP0361-20130328/24858_1 /ASSEMBLY_ACC=CAM_ASM_000343 /TAXON_ID=268821 /ORGANISM="Scrippsiella Hangoei, Strain SHTV-5" /LENGTH=450 /DNA_ID=CAMNT_0051104545 /DNA_START=6 /DNA_END=1358 /DNA_ORIENTATION=-